MAEGHGQIIIAIILIIIGIALLAGAFFDTGVNASGVAQTTTTGQYIMGIAGVLLILIGIGIAASSYRGHGHSHHVDYTRHEHVIPPMGGPIYGPGAPVQAYPPAHYPQAVYSSPPPQIVQG